MKALLLVDIQNDFSPSGALPVKEGDLIIPFVNEQMPAYDLVVATQDWHPKNHGSFADNHPGKNPGDLIQLAGIDQILWPVHCVQNTFGAEFINGLKTEKIDHIIQKGMNPEIDSYSGFFDNDHRQETGLHQYLQANKIKELVIAGLATDYCVKYTALDAVNLGYQTTILSKGVRGVELNPGDIDKAISDMKTAGIQIL